MSTCRRHTIQLSKIIECQRAAAPPLDLASSFTGELTPAAFGCWIRLSLQPKAGLNTPFTEKFPLRRRATGGNPQRSLYLFYGGKFETGGKVYSMNPTCFNPYPKAFCVMTSVCVIRNDAKASLRPRLHPGN